MQTQIKYQLFNARILFFVFLNVFWLVVYNIVFDGRETLGTTILFFSGLLFIDAVIFPKTGNWFYRKGTIVVDEEELRFILMRKTKAFKRSGIRKLERNEFKKRTMEIWAITVCCAKRKYRLYLEDITEGNKAVYDKVLNELMDMRNVCSKDNIRN